MDKVLSIRYRPGSPQVIWPVCSAPISTLKENDSLALYIKFTGGACAYRAIGHHDPFQTVEGVSLSKDLRGLVQEEKTDLYGEAGYFYLWGRGSGSHIMQAPDAHKRVREEAKEQRKSFMLKFVLFCPKMWIFISLLSCTYSSIHSFVHSFIHSQWDAGHHNGALRTDVMNKLDKCLCPWSWRSSRGDRQMSEGDERQEES